MAPATAITHGDPDDGDHPYVGLSVYFYDDDGDPETPMMASHRCSGTLISETLYVTAGHCTFGMDAAMIWLAEDVQTDQGSNGYPDFSDLPGDLYMDAWGKTGYTVTGNPDTFPAYDDGAFFLNDLGVVVLDESVVTALGHGGEYASLPEAGAYDGLKRGRKTTFTSVGYGLQFSTGTANPAWPDGTPSPVSALKIRLQAQPWLLQIGTPGFTGDFSFLLSNNAAAGGTCFGDSGGPNFFGDSTEIAAVTSFALNGSCGGTGGVWRLDKQDAIDWINGDHS
jgi:hypothetical protein